MSTRRSLLKAALLAPFVPPPKIPPAALKPARLKPGDTVGLVCPAAPAYSRETVRVTIESLAALGLKTKLTPHFYDRYGYLAGRDADRAADARSRRRGYLECVHRRLVSAGADGWRDRSVSKTQPPKMIRWPKRKNESRRCGPARGQLASGNLTVLCHLVGSPYLPDWRGKILFVEDTHEDVYSVDRMLTHLKLA